MKYDLATAVRCSGTFRDLAGALADPDTITMILQRRKTRVGTGTETSYHFGASTMVRDSVGQYHFDAGPWVLDDVGLWRYRYVGTGAVRVGGWREFEVVDPGFANPYGT